MRRLFRLYGAGPLHLLCVIACVVVSGYVVTRIHAEGGWVRIAAWFALAVIVHDLIVWPLYALADRSALRIARRHPKRFLTVPWINHVRVPAIISGVLLGISFPLIFQLSSRYYAATTGMSESPYLGRWLLVTGILFAVSAAVYALRLARAHRRGAHAERATDGGAAPRSVGKHSAAELPTPAHAAPPTRAVDPGAAATSGDFPTPAAPTTNARPARTRK